MTVSSVDLCNLALSRAGGQRITQITSLTEASEEARQCAVKYPQLLRVALREYPWRFATKQAELASLGYGTERFQYCFQYPADCLHARGIVGLGDTFLPFEMELGRDGSLMICCDTSQAVLMYTAEVTDPNIWDALFYDALAWKLASELAITLGNDYGKARALEERAANVLDKARTADSREHWAEEERGAYLKARE